MGPPPVETLLSGSSNSPLLFVEDLEVPNPPRSRTFRAGPRIESGVSQNLPSPPTVPGYWPDENFASTAVQKVGFHPGGIFGDERFFIIRKLGWVGRSTVQFGRDGA